MIRKLISYISLFIILLVTGCSADEPFLLPRGDGQTQLKLLIPSTSMARATGQTRGADIATRAHATTADLADGEGSISYFHIVGFYTDKSGKRRHFYQKLTPDMGEAVDGMYRSFLFNVEPADYHLYMIANFEPTAIMDGLVKDDDEADADVEELENNVKALTQTYSADNMPKLYMLPMSAYQEVKVAPKTAAQVEMNLKFLCAKVRVTIVHEDLGKTGLYVDALKASNVYEILKPFQKNDAPDKFDIDENCAAVEGHFQISTQIRGKSAEDLAKIPTNDLTDPLETLTDEITNLAACGNYAYQGVVYLPESESATYSTYPTTLTAVMSDSKTEIPFKAGCNAELDADHNSKNPSLVKLERGHFYDLVARIVPGDIQFSWKVVDWDPKTITIKLAGGSDLFVGKTVIPSDSEIADGIKINGSETYRIPYATTVPGLSFQSDQYNGKDIFDLRENKDEGVIEVSLSSNIAIGTTIPGTIGFWVVAGSIRKYIEVKAIDTQAYVRITPKNRNLYISQIVNDTSYDLWYEYSTNMGSLTLDLKEYVNSNTRNGIPSGNNGGMRIGVYTGTETEYEQYSKEVALSADMVVSNIEKATGITGEFPKTGVIRITIVEPGDQQAFGSVISGTLVATGTNPETKTAEATFNIEPNPSKYIIHFKGRNADNETWASPHIYVYQPLEYKDKEVYDNLGKKEGKLEGGLNWLEYSFTGCLVFKGWKSEMGEIDDLTTEPYSFKQNAGISVFAYTAWDNIANEDAMTTNGKYYTDIDLIKSHRTAVKTKTSLCADCRKDSEMKRLWPGITMIPEGDGWWKIEIPLLAEPGKALIMFANGHDGKYTAGITDNGNGTTKDNCFSNENNNNPNPTNRHPTAGTPGIPLPNFASCEAWFLYDASVDRQKLAFSDYKREAYSSSVVTPPAEDEKTVKVSFRAPLNSTDTGISQKLNMWTYSTNLTGAYPGDLSLNVVDDYVYWTYSITINKTQTPADVISGFQFTDDGTTGSDTDIAWSGHYAEVTDEAKKTAYGNCDYLYTIWAGASEPLPNTYVPPIGTHYMICWPLNDSWGDKIYMWIVKDNIKTEPLGTWNSDSNKEQWKNNNYYWKWVEKENFLNGSLSLDDGYQFLNIANNANKGKDTNFDINKVEEIKLSDIPSDIPMGDNVVIIKAFKINYQNY